MLFQAARLIILNGIEDIPRPDLADRAEIGDLSAPSRNNDGEPEKKKSGTARRATAGGGPAETVGLPPAPQRRPLTEMRLENLKYKKTLGFGRDEQEDAKYSVRAGDCAQRQFGSKPQVLG